MSGLFATLNISKTGMFAQQQYINVTSHNMSNARTEGYSRQHVVLEAARPQTIYGGAGQIGTGVNVASIERTRNQFLDYQIRKESTHLNQYGVRSDYLSQVEGIFNEPSDTGISKLMSELFDAWQILSTNSDKSDARTVVAQKAKALADELNHNYKKLNDTKTNALSEIQQNVFEVNSILDQLNSVNKEIITVTIAGNNPNDLMDRRDLLLDKLSTKFGIDTKNQNLNGMLITPEGQSDINFVRNQDNEKVRKLAYVSEIKVDKNTNERTIVYYKNGDMTSSDNRVEITMSEEDFKKLDGKVGPGSVFLTNEDGQIVDKNGNPSSKGESIKNSIFDTSSGVIGGLQSIDKDVDGYIEQMDTLAKTIAFAVNAVHTEGIPADKQIPFFINKNLTPPADIMDFDGINAGNITINPEILKNPMLIEAGKKDSSGEGDGKRALAIAQLRDYRLNITNIQNGKDANGDPYDYDKFVEEHFGDTAEGSIPESKEISGGMKIEGFYKNSINKLGVQAEEANRIVENQSELLKGLLSRRQSVSAVSIDEETINLVQFQHAFQANAKVISTVDQLLDVVVNGLVR